MIDPEVNSTELATNELKEIKPDSHYEVFNTYSKYMLWMPLILLINANAIWIADTTFKEAYFYCQVIISIVWFVFLIKEVKQVKMLKLYSRDLSLDQNTLPSSSIESVYINNQFITIIKKEGSVFTKGIRFKAKHKDEAASLFQDLYQFCSRNHLSFKREM